MSANQTRKVMIDMSRKQSIWAAWFIGLVIVAYMIFPLFGIQLFNNNKLGELVTRVLSGYWGEGEIGTDAGGFLSFISHPSRIFMLAIGIGSIGFLVFYVKQGVTRKAYYKGAIVSGIVVSLIIALSSGIVSIIDKVFLASGTAIDSNWFLSLIVLALHIYVYHIAGWLIGVGFHRHTVLGLLMIVVAVALAFAIESLWGNALNTWTNLTGGTAMLVSIIGTMALCIAVLWGIWMLTRKIRVRLK